jgi:hypothetical protein
MEFEDFWNPPQPPDEGGDNNSNDDLTPQISFQVVQVGQGGTKIPQSLKPRKIRVGRVVQVSRV